MPSPSPLLEDIRSVSRAMVRELGFMGEDFAGTQLSPSAVHALIEIEAGALTAGTLGQRLGLEKSSVSRLLRRLVWAGDVHKEASPDDARRKMLRLTPGGKQRVAGIHAHARAQVSQALARLACGQDRAVLEGLRLYTQALAGQVAVAQVQLVEGYQPGLIAAITQMHAHFYAHASGFGQSFEAGVASGLAEFSHRLEHPGNGVWAALDQGRIVGSIVIDGQDLGPDKAHLRWFIVDDSVRGSGAGRSLLAAALAFVDQQAFAETHLWTFDGLGAARHLYELHGFECVQQRPGSQWGSEVLEQHFVRPRPVSAYRP